MVYIVYEVYLFDGAYFPYYTVTIGHYMFLPRVVAFEKGLVCPLAHSIEAFWPHLRVRQIHGYFFGREGKPFYGNRKCVEGGHKSSYRKPLGAVISHRKARFGGTFAMEGLCVLIAYEGPFTHNSSSGFGCDI